MTLPSVVRLSLVRTKAGPLPGLTCWNSTILKIVPSTSMCVPFLNWFVEIISFDPVRDLGLRGVHDDGASAADDGRLNPRVPRRGARRRRLHHLMFNARLSSGGPPIAA